MLTVLYVIHVFLCLSLIVIVLIQQGKGSGVGLSIGGGMSQTMFGGSGGRTFFMKLTSGFAVAFMITSVILAVIASHGTTSYHGVLSNSSGPAAPSSPATQPAQPAQPSPAGPQPLVPAPRPGTH